MAIPATPQNLAAQQGNNEIYISFNASVGATSYDIQRSLDGVNFTSYDTTTINEFSDDAVTLGTQYWFKVAAVNGLGTSAYTSSVTAIPAPDGEMSLYELRLRSQQKADRVNSNFVATTEWNAFISLACYELYDLLITEYEDYYKAPNVRFTTNGSQYIYPLPNGSNTFTADDGSTFTPRALYKLLGVDLGLQTANNAFVTVNKYNLIDRNRYVYPNTASTIYGVFNMQYRMMGSNIEFVPTPSGNQVMRLLYIPKLPPLIKDRDLTTIGGSGWIQYVIVRAAMYALAKEESDISNLKEELIFLKDRIEASAMNRDAGQADRVSDTAGSNGWGGRFGSGYNGPSGGM